MFDFNAVKHIIITTLGVGAVSRIEKLGEDRLIVDITLDDAETLKDVHERLVERLPVGLLLTLQLTPSTPPPAPKETP